MIQPQQIPGTPKEIVRAIQILFISIIAGPVLFAVIVLFFNNTGSSTASNKDARNILLPLNAGLAVICFAVAWTGYKKSIVTAKDSSISLTGKLNLYRSTLIRYIVLCEMPGLLGVIVFFMTGNYFALTITAAMLAAMFLKAPVKKRIIDDLEIDWQQQGEI